MKLLVRDKARPRDESLRAGMERAKEAEILKCANA